MEMYGFPLSELGMLAAILSRALQEAETVNERRLVIRLVWEIGGVLENQAETVSLEHFWNSPGTNELEALGAMRRKVLAVNSVFPPPDGGNSPREMNLRASEATRATKCPTTRASREQPRVPLAASLIFEPSE
jgi:hypothetical protein